MMKKLRSTFIGFALAAVLVAGVALPTQAASIGLTGSVNYADAGNPWGINTNTGISGTAYWDENLLSGGPEFLDDFIDPSLNLQLVLGGFSYDFSNDISFKLLTFGFFDGMLKQIALTGEGPLGEFFDIAFGAFAGVSDFTLNDGVYVATGEIAPVPEPGTFLLLGAGLGGLIYVQRRRKQG